MTARRASAWAISTPLSLVTGRLAVLGLVALHPDRWLGRPGLVGLALAAPARRAAAATRSLQRPWRQRPGNGMVARQALEAEERRQLVSLARVDPPLSGAAMTPTN